MVRHVIHRGFETRLPYSAHYARNKRRSEPKYPASSFILKINPQISLFQPLLAKQ